MQRNTKLSATYYNNRVTVRNETTETPNATLDNVVMGRSCTLSCNQSQVVLNARRIAITEAYRGGTSSQVCLGGYNASSHVLNGKIYAVRVYSRLLTDDEIFYNQQIDNVRFGLGLDLTGGIVPYVPSRSVSRTLDFVEDNER